MTGLQIRAFKSFAGSWKLEVESSQRSAP